MHDDSDVGVADLISAVGGLRVREETLVRRVAALLQIEATPRARVVPPPPPPPPPPPEIEITEPPPPPKVEPRAPEFRPMDIERTRRDDAPPFAASLPTLPPATSEADEKLPPLQPLLEPSWTRGIVSHALATPSPHGPVDLRAIADQLSRGEAIRRLPRRTVPTLRKGAQVLVDRGSGMAPFLRDADALAIEIARVVGHEAATVLHFRGLPIRGVADVKRRKRLAYEPPTIGVPVALITDFGIGFDDLATDRATTREWVEFLRGVRRTDSPIVAFVPYPRQRVAREIAAMATIVEWDRRTSLVRLRAAMRRLR